MGIVIRVRLWIRVLSLVIVGVLVGLGVIVVVVIWTLTGSGGINGTIVRSLVVEHGLPFFDLHRPTDIIGDRVYVIQGLIVTESHSTGCVLATTGRLVGEEGKRFASSSARGDNGQRDNI